MSAPVLDQQPATLVSTPADPLRVSGGLISGDTIADSNVRAFRGIPFAAPPVGALRWKEPQPVVPWDGVRACVEYGASCPQPHAYIGGDVGRQGEDCLYLNVWAPASAKASAGLPVMLWIHGGGFATGSSSLPYYDGRRLAEKGVVVVTINYRLGPFGFLAHPLLSKESPNGVSGNYGLLDQIAALRWVHENIAAFGGDPSSVTAFGESAGSSSICRLLVSPPAKGLFHRAIVQSGGPFGYNRHLRDNANNLPSMESVGEKVASKLGCAKADDVLSAMRAVSTEDILAAAKPSLGIYGKGTFYGPVVDGWLIPDDPDVMWSQGRQLPMPLIVGTNADEGTLFLRVIPIKQTAMFKLAAREMFGSWASKILPFYPVTGDDEVPSAICRIITDTSFVMPARAVARAMGKAAPTYLYQFSKTSPKLRDLGLGATHASEIPYIFQTLDDHLAYDDGDFRLADDISSAWVRFAATGDPNGGGMANWPIYRETDDAHLRFGDDIRAESGLRRAECDLYDQMWAQRETTGMNPTALR